MAARRCARTFLILDAGGVRTTWACGATRTDPHETAVDVEYLADHLPTYHLHRIHLPQHRHTHHLTHKE